MLNILLRSNGGGRAFVARGRAIAWSFWAVLAALVAWIYWPVLSADFVADDYVFVATARMVDAPWVALWQSHFYEPYYFRPIGVWSWWVATRLFGLDYAPHSAINLVLHVINAGLLLMLLRALALRGSAVAAGVVMFALGPFTLTTTFWPSNRFDLFAVGFLLLQAIAMLRALRGSAAAVLPAALMALAACWSKELAYPVATVLACCALFAVGVSVRRRVVLFVSLGLAIGFAFFWRNAVLVNAFALPGDDRAAQVVAGVRAISESIPKLMALVVGAAWASWLIGLLALAVIAGVLSLRRAGGRFRLFIAALAVLSAAFFVQTPLAAAFAPMMDLGPFGVVSFARFYYAPCAAFAVLVAIALSHGWWGRVFAVGVFIGALASAVSVRTLGEQFAQWARNEVRPVSVAATMLVDDQISSPCVVVLLGTQDRHPFFRMFSDVTVKARSRELPRVGSCWVMTESTPWLFAFPGNVGFDLTTLRPVPGIGGVAKPDSAWGGVLYRYRLPALTASELSGARYFDWRDGVFVDVTDAVRSGAQKVALRDW